ncbi:hypothetical protein FDJ47_gp19 [Enterobacter phage Ec_L1]|uniref:Uncharacterized protein n=1 Tax=Enterobacter phage Ec_L1 TaxID=2070180 RepID=A0A2P0W9V4_9CAUD|nr:hypothetical protein FDJ47_gp19 [Enterobacter phage Ec_L1]AUV57133.1 hypothetical protein Ec19 [Enterobacter phage Ec_L1]
MAKSIKLKCTMSLTKTFNANHMIKAKVDDEGNVTVGKGKEKIALSVGVSGDIFISSGGVVAATFVELKTKTLKCMSLDHKNPMKKSFKVGKRYQVDSGRALGGVAGYIFDEDGCPWNLYREDVGFSVADGTTFEAKYL